MSEQALHGLSCPRCGGMTPIPEGVAVVRCPYCDLRSVVKVQAPAGASSGADAAPGAQNVRGIRRYQAPVRVDRDQAVDALRGFLAGKFQVARNAAKESKLTEAFLVHLPFWTVWGRGVAWAFGQQKVGSGDDARYEPRERKVVKEMVWNAPACEVGEFGVRQVGLEGCPLEPFEPEALHRTGMVFEPVGSVQHALESARQSFEKAVAAELHLSRISQTFTRLTRPRLGLVYYPLWVLRYLYHGRAFQVVVDGFNGEVLYGKAPGSVGYRAGVLVAGMALGSAVAVDGPLLILSVFTSSEESDPFIIALITFLAGLGIMYGAYRTFRHGEHYTYHRRGAPAIALMQSLPGDLGKATKMLPDDVQQHLRAVQAGIEAGQLAGGQQHRGLSSIDEAARRARKERGQ